MFVAMHPFVSNISLMKRKVFRIVVVVVLGLVICYYEDILSCEMILIPLFGGIVGIIFASYIFIYRRLLFFKILIPHAVVVLMLYGNAYYTLTLGNPWVSYELQHENELRHGVWYILSPQAQYIVLLSILNPHDHHKGEYLSVLLITVLTIIWFILLRLNLMNEWIIIGISCFTISIQRLFLCHY
jgi:hypothetical protein